MNVSVMKISKAYQFMQAAIDHTKFSKDPSTKVGCLIVGPAGEIRSHGYNGMVRGADDNNEERMQRPEKYFWFEHAERNAIYNAARVGVPLEGSTLFVTMPPCMDCARAIVQSGIKEVYTCSFISPNNNWEEQANRTRQLFKESGILYHTLLKEDFEWPIYSQRFQSLDSSSISPEKKTRGLMHGIVHVFLTWIKTLKKIRTYN